jgi:hypothetical protein
MTGPLNSVLLIDRLLRLGQPAFLVAFNSQVQLINALRATVVHQSTQAQEVVSDEVECCLKKFHLCLEILRAFVPNSSRDGFLLKGSIPVLLFPAPAPEASLAIIHPTRLDESVMDLLLFPKVSPHPLNICKR